MALSGYKIPALGALLVTAAGAAAVILPSGADRQDAEQAHTQGPAAILAQADPQRFSPSLREAEVGPITELSASELRGTMEFDGAVRVTGNVTNSRVHLIADHVEIVGSVTGENIFIHARDERDRTARRPDQAQVNTGQIIIHGDVNITDSQIGAPGTASILINGHAELNQNSPMAETGGGYLTAQNVCITGDVHNESGGRVLADNFTVGRDLTGEGISATVYTYRAVNGQYPGRTVIGGDLNADNSVIINGEIAVGGQKVGQGLNLRQHRPAEPITADDTNCGFSPQTQPAPTAARP